MTLAQVGRLTYFRDGERALSGAVLDWAQADYETMQALELLRQRLDSPINIIRLAHPGKPTAIDWCCTGLPYRAVVMEVLRLPVCSYGFYSGNSVHIDRRIYTGLPARWLAIKESERFYLNERGLARLAGRVANGWIYLAWDYEALKLVVDLAERKSRDTPVGV